MLYIKRYSLAHELAHWLIEEYSITHVSKGDLNLDYLRIEDDIYLQEHIAEYFAGAILMPKTLIEEFWKKEDGLKSDNIRRLADMFDVSDSALEIRLQQISKLPTWYKLLDEEEIEGRILSRFQHPKVLQTPKLRRIIPSFDPRNRNLITDLSVFYQMRLRTENIYIL